MTIFVYLGAFMLLCSFRNFVLTGTAIASMGLISAASAADLVRAVAPAAPMGVSWQGIYVGGHLGTSWGQSDWRNPTGFFAVPPSDLPAKGATDGLLGGLQVGYNHQIGAWVMGVGADVSLTAFDGHANTGGLPGFGGSGSFSHTRSNTLASFTGRIGYAEGRTLYYVKGGLGYAHDKYDNSSFFFPQIGSASANRWGWTFGIGAEYAMGAGWSAFGEYNVYDFGRKTMTFSGAGLLPAPSTYTIGRTQQVVKFGVNYRWGWDNTNLSAPVVTSDMKGEFGTRLGLSTGKFRKDLFAPANANQLNSRLTYPDLTAASLEGFVRLDHTSGVFAKANIGGANVYGGKLFDEDFPPAIAPYSDTVSQQKNGRQTYGTMDLGYTFLRGQGWNVGAFVGYHFYNQRLNARGCNQIAGNPFVCSPGQVPAGQLTISEREEWKALRLGLSGETYITNRIKLSGDVAYTPYVDFKSTDSHWLRPNINALRESATGHAGFMAEAILSYDVTRDLSVGLGARYAYLKADKGSTAFPFTPPSPMKFETSRYGAFLQAAYKFGAPAEAVVAKY